MAAPLVPAQARTVASPLFKGLNLAQVIDPNFNVQIGFLRALKVFLMSYVEYENLSPQLYNQKIIEFGNSLEVLYNHAVQDINQYIQQLLPIMAMETIQIRVGVIRFKGRNVLIAPRVEWFHNGLNIDPPVPLDMNREVQSINPFNVNLTVPELRQHRQHNTEIRIHLLADNLDANQELNVFRIGYQEIHAEGYEDWFDFGRGVQLLIKIEFKVSVEPNITSEAVSQFHFQTVLAIIGRRIDEYRAQNRNTTGHREVCHKSKLIYIRKRVDPNSEQAFWTTPKIDVFENIRDINTSQLQTIGSTKYSDLQIGYQFHHEFEDRVCLCSEWCNWNAFFHYNPIYRFLVVQHNQLYLRNRTNIPHMYLFISTFYSYDAGAHLQPNQQLPKTPVLQLMGSANDYRIRYYKEFYLLIPNFSDDLVQSHPNFALLTGLTYNYLRYHHCLPVLCLQSDPNPFADICMKNMIRCHEIMADLHGMIARIVPFVGQNVRKQWFEELDTICRIKYKNLIKRCYVRQMTLRHNYFDYLLTEDYDNSHALPPSEGARDVRAIRENVLKMFTNGNPFNLRQICNEFIFTFLSIHKFLTKVEPTLPKPHRSTGHKNMFQCLKTMDTDFDVYHSQQNIPQTMDFTLPDNELHRRGFGGLRESFYVFYTLKLYYIGFGIQKSCLETLIKYQKNSPYPTHQAFVEFRFMFSNNVIENTYRTQYPNSDPLYALNPDLLANIDDFYHQYWGEAQHKINAQNWQIMHQFIDSAYSEYRRLYFWWNNGGNNRLKFSRIFITFNDNFEDLIVRSELIYATHVMPSIQWLSQNYEFHCEVWDHLVYYLAKADCFFTLTVVSQFLLPFNQLRSQHNVARRLSYSLTQPGWLQMFQTMATVMYCLDCLKPLYIVFDDEFNRISNTFSQTKRMVKGMYRLFFKNSSMDWLYEIIHIYNQANLAQPLSANLIQVHFAVGLSFFGHFIDEFRRETMTIRKVIRTIFATNPITPHQTVLRNCSQVYDTFLSDRNAMLWTEPLRLPLWQNHLQQIMNVFNALTEQDVNINLAAADV